MKTTAVLLSLVASSVAQQDEPNIGGVDRTGFGGVGNAGGDAGGDANKNAGGFTGDFTGGLAGNSKKPCFFKPSKCAASCTQTFDTTKDERGANQDTSKCVIPDGATGTQECYDGDCDPLKDVAKSSADIAKEKTAICGSFTATTKTSCEKGIQDMEDAKAAGTYTAPQQEDQETKDKKLSDKMKECVATINGKTFTGDDAAAKKIAKDAEAKSCRDKVIDETVGEAAAIGDYIDKDELTQKAERDYDQQDRIADAKGGNPCSRLAVGTAKTRCTKCRVEKTDDAECTATKDPERALMDCLNDSTKTKEACKAAAVINTAVKSGKTTDEAVGSDFANMFKDIEREFDQQKAAKVLTDAAGGCKSKSSKELRKKCFDDKLKSEAAKTNAKPLAELKREVEEAAVDGKVTHFSLDVHY